MKYICVVIKHQEYIVETETFKTILKENKEVLKGRTLSIFIGKTDWEETFTTLKGFGEKILELEKEGFRFSFEDSLTKVRAIYTNHNYTALSIEEMTEEIKRFGTAA